MTATFPPYDSGTGNVCFHNARVLANRGHDVHVYTVGHQSNTADDPPGVFVHRLRPMARIGNAALVPQLARMPANSIVHIHFPFYGGAEFAMLSRRPYIVTYHQDVEIVGPLGKLTRAHDRTVGKQVLKHAAKLCPTTIDYVESSRFAPVFQERPLKLAAVPNGVDTTVFLPGPSQVDIRAKHQLGPNKPIVLFVGSMDDAHFFKGVPVLLQAAALVPELSVLLVGEGNRRGQYERLATELGLGNRAEFAGRVSDSELPSYYRSADITVLPSETRGEAFGLVLIEAMACECPVIATDLPGVRSVVSDGVDGVLVPPSNPEALAAAMNLLTKIGPEQRKQMGAVGREKVVAKFDWERIGDQLESIYCEVWNAHECRL